MIIALDARHVQTKTGTGRIVYNLYKNLLIMDKKNTYILLCSHKNVFADITKPTIKRIAQSWNNKPLQRTIWEYTLLPLLLRLYHVDVFYSPENFTSVSFWGGKQVISILDLIPLVFPEYIQSIRRRKRFELKVKSSLKHYAHIVTISEYSKKEIMDHFGIAKDAISVMWLGADIINTQGRQATDVLGHLGIQRPYILALGGLEYRKNNRKLIQAYMRLPSPLLKTYDLVIVGRSSTHLARSSMPRIAQPLKEKIHFLDQVSDNDLAILYQNAYLFSFLSMYEGFGLPIIEAMKYKTMVLCSNVTSIPEAAGDAAYMTSVEKVWDITNALCKILNKEVDRDAYISKGEKWAAQFTWERTAHTLLQVFEKVGVS